VETRALYTTTRPARRIPQEATIENRTLPARPASAFLTTPGHRVRDTWLHTCTPAHDSDALRCEEVDVGRGLRGRRGAVRR
jgi:hypothetical protein